MAETDTEIAIAAAAAGADVVRSYYGGTVERLDKGRGDFATTADIEAERRIVEILRTARPGDAVIGEESGHTGDGPRTWLVDPLCGTLNFAAHTPLVAVNVALRTSSGITAAASAEPFTGDIFWTDGRQAVVRRDGHDEPLTPSALSGLVDVELDPPFPAGRVLRLLADERLGDRYRVRAISSTLAVVWVAAGRRTAYVTERLTPDSVHYDGPIAICRAAGCVVTGIDGQPLYTGAGGLIVAADAGTHAALLSMMDS